MKDHLRLAHLFSGRTDVWGAEWGECIKRPLTMDDWESHCYGDGSVGVYPLCEGDVVKWGCVDVDEGYDQIAIALNVCRALRQLGLTAHLERTRSKGFHCWVLLSEWTKAESVRSALFFACQVVDYKPKEVNPKAAHLRPGFVSNYVNVPWSRKWAEQGRRVVLNMDTREPYDFLEWLDLAEETVHSNTPSAVAKAAALYKPPPPPRAIVIPRGVAPRQLRGFVKDYFETGPHENQDRSTALQHFAHMLQRDGFSAGEALSLVAEFDQRLGKFVGRPDAEKNYERIVSNAYG